MAPARRLRLALVTDVLEALGDPHRRLRILDAGCGDGLLTLAMAQRHPMWELTGYDLSDELLEGARRRASARSLPNVSFAQADLMEPLPETRFDVVLAIECLTEVPDDHRVLQGLAGAVAPGGWLLAHVPERSWSPILRGSSPIWRAEVRHGYRPEEISVSLRDAGLVEVEVVPTLRGTVTLAQEVRDRHKRGPLAVRALLYPLMLAAVALERRGLTWGSRRALLARGRRPAEAPAR